MEIENIIHPSGTIIANQYEVVVGPREKKHLMGGMGWVYLCQGRTVEDHPVALKTFQAKYLSDRATRDRFLREGTIWSVLEYHPFLVQLYNVRRVGDGREIYFVLEYVAPGAGKAGASLREWLYPGKPPVSLAQSLRWMWELAQGLAYATQRQPGFVHRDVKPENILIGRDGHARVTDLGLARCITSNNFSSDEPGQPADSPDDEPQNLQRTRLTRHAIGTPLYMAPERWQGTHELDARSDIYAWGCVLLELLTGQSPLSFRTAQECEVGHTIGQVGHHAERLPTGVRELVSRCVAVDRMGRYATWTELLSELEDNYPTWTQSPLPQLPIHQAATKAQRLAKGLSLNALGCSYLDIGKPKVAIKYFQYVQDIGKAENDQALQAAALGNLGATYQHLGDMQRAIPLLEEALVLAREIGDRAGEMAALTSLGGTYANLGDPHRALSLYEQALSLARELGNRMVEGVALDSLGAAYHLIGDLQRAIPFQEEALAIAREIGDRLTERNALENLGTTYGKLGDLQQALSLYEEALAIAREIGNRAKEMGILANQGITYGKLGDLQQALSLYEEALALARETGDRAKEMRILANQGSTYYELGDPQRAIPLQEEALALAREIGDRAEEMSALGNLANAYRVLGDLQLALTYFKQHQVLAREIGDFASETACNFNLALLFKDLENLELARLFAGAALEGFTELGNAVHVKHAQQILEPLQ